MDCPEHEHESDDEDEESDHDSKTSQSRSQNGMRERRTEIPSRIFIPPTRITSPWMMRPTGIERRRTPPRMKRKPKLFQMRSSKSKRLVVFFMGVFYLMRQEMQGKGREFRRILDDSRKGENHHQRDRDAADPDTVEDSGDDDGSDAVGGGVHVGTIAHRRGVSRVLGPVRTVF